MKTYKEMADDALNRISQYETEKQNKKKKAIKFAVPALSCCLLAAVCIGMWQGGALKDRRKLAIPDIDTKVQTYSTEEEKRLTQGSYGDQPQEGAEKKEDPVKDTPKGTGSTESIAQFWWKNKIVMYGDLYWALNDNPDGTFAVTATFRPTPQNVKDFFYEGKSLFELAVDADNERMMPEKMMQLLKCGDELKLGPAICETGLPDGTKWDRALYEEQVAFFGNLLDKYIVNGEFLRSALEADIAALQRINVSLPDGTTTTIINGDTSARKQYSLAYSTYLESVLAETEKILSGHNIKCERVPYATASLNMVLTAEELENLPLEHMEFWVFGLTNNNLKSSQPADLAE